MSLFEDFFADGRTTQAVVASNQRGFLRSGISAQPQFIAARKHDRIPTPENHQSILSELDSQLTWLEEKSICIVCNGSFVRKENIGRMKCRWHPNFGPDTQKTACCGRSPESRGCKPCDHSRLMHRWTPGNDTETIPLAVAIHLGLPPSVYTVVPADSYRNTKALVKRCLY